jgi:hypothetical protein
MKTPKPPFTDFSNLLRVVSNLGVLIDEASRERLEKLWDGEEIEGSRALLSCKEIGGGLYDIMPDGSVIRVIVHAAQGPSRMRSQVSEEDLLNKPEHWHKFHIVWCKTLDEWHTRLRKTNRNDGKFTYPVIGKDGIEFKPELSDGGRELYLCKNCIKLTPGFSGGLVFDLQKYLKDGPTLERFSSIDHVSDFDRIPNIYPSDWSRIATAFKEMRSWRCEACFIDLSGSSHRQYLHAHHIDSRPHNCSITNLKALCIRCHAAQHRANTAFQISTDLMNFNRLFPSKGIT